MAPVITQTAMRLLLQLVDQAAPVVPLYVPASKTKDGKKGVYPSPITCESDLFALIEEHLKGAGITPRSCRRNDGTSWTERRAYGVGAYALRHRPSGQRCGWICLDIDGADHGSSDGLALTAARAAMDLLQRRSLNPFLERSHGGHGFHVWVLFESEQSGGFAHWLASTVRDVVQKQHPSAKVEAFPKQPSHAHLGSAVSLPLAGAASGTGGGRVLWPDLRERDASTIESAMDEAIRPLLARYDEFTTVRCQRLESEMRLATQRLDDARTSGVDAIERCQRYLAAIAPAIEGAGGDMATYAACLVGGDFGLSEEQFLPLISAWNLRCNPPWSDLDLLKKVRSAYRSRQRPLGWRLTTR